MPEIKLNAQKREVVGRKVKKLRKEGFVPANVYGKKVKSQAILLKKENFEKAFSVAGKTGVVKLTIEGEKEERPILIQNVQAHPVTDEVLHVDLRQIILTEKVIAKIPVELQGESPAVEQKLGILIQPVSEIEVEALPMDLPEKFVVDISKLANVGDEILVKDLSVDRKKIDLKIENSLVVVKIEPLAAEEVVAPPPAEEAPPVGGPVEGEAPAAPAKGEQPAEEKKPEESN